MSKKPKIKNAYDHDKDRMEISIRGYSLSKITRDEILENDYADRAQPRSSSRNLEKSWQEVGGR
jgi:hypothetical protein